MSIPKTVVSEREDSSRPVKKRPTIASSPMSAEQPTTSTDDAFEPPKKLVRWRTAPDVSTALGSSSSLSTPSPNSSVPIATHAFLEKSVDKMSRREQQKRWIAPVNEMSEAELQASMDRIKRNIHKAARKELALLNESKKIRQFRQKLTVRHQQFTKALRRAQQANGSPDADAVSDDSPSQLPPLFPVTGSRTTNTAVINLCE